MSRVRMKDRLAPWFKDRFLIEGVMPERALLRLKRAGISVFNVKKPQKNQILFSISKKDSEKVFIYNLINIVYYFANQGRNRRVFYDTSR